MKIVTKICLAFCLYTAVFAEKDEDNESKESLLKEVTKDTLEHGVTFLLFTRGGEDNGTEVTEENISDFNSDKPVKFIAHGWLESSNKEWYTNLTEALLKKSDCSVVQVNWSPLARLEYSVSAKSTQVVGEKIAKLIERLYKDKGIPLNHFQVIGHSLGGHVAGFAGKNVIKLTGSKIWKITALDAAGPLFEKPEKPKEERLSSEDAEIVENIHTDGGALGFKAPLGTIDYFANDGSRNQPGCGALETIKAFSLEKIAGAPNCSHSKSYMYYIRALNGEKFEAKKCDSWENYKDGKCENNQTVNLGDDLGSDVTGSFFFQTNDTE